MNSNEINDLTFKSDRLLEPAVRPHPSKTGSFLRRGSFRDHLAYHGERAPRSRGPVGAGPMHRQAVMRQRVAEAQWTGHRIACAVGVGDVVVRKERVTGPRCVPGRYSKQPLSFVAGSSGSQTVPPWWGGGR